MNYFVVTNYIDLSFKTLKLSTTSHFKLLKELRYSLKKKGLRRGRASLSLHAACGAEPVAMEGAEQREKTSAFTPCLSLKIVPITDTLWGTLHWPQYNWAYAGNYYMK